MRMGWFPASMDRPETVFTFRLLKTFQELNFQAKTNLHDYWKTLERITDNSGGADVPVSFIFKDHPSSSRSSLMILSRIDTSNSLMPFVSGVISRC